MGAHNLDWAAPSNPGSRGSRCSEFEPVVFLCVPPEQQLLLVLRVIRNTCSEALPNVTVALGQSVDRKVAREHAAIGVRTRP